MAKKRFVPIRGAKIRLEKLSFNDIKLLDCGINEKERQKQYGIKRQEKTHLGKLDDSINDNGWAFPLIVAELPNKEKWLIDGYARWKLETKKKSTKKDYDTLIIQAKDLNHAKELYLQCQSRYGTANAVDFRALDGEQGYSRYETGIPHPQFDISIMTREEIAEFVRETKYQII